MRDAIIVVLTSVFLLLVAGRVGWSCRGIEESTNGHCVKTWESLPVNNCADEVASVQSASAITCAMAIGATVDALHRQRETAIDDWAEDHADDSIDEQLPLEKWRELE